MTVPVPDYVKVQGIRDPSIRYYWDDWNVEAADMPLDPELLARLEAMSHRAVVAFTIGAAEWIIYRFSSLLPDMLTRLYIEAAWGQVVDFHYCTHYDINLDDWRGPVRGPVGTAIRRVKFAAQQADINGKPTWRAARISRLVEHVLPTCEAYLNWRDRVIDRFVSLYPFDPEETLGEVVPWQFADPDREVSTEETEQLVNEFLQSLRLSENPFLNSPEIMIKSGFEGKPYQFDIEQDRRSRFEW